MSHYKGTVFLKNGNWELVDNPLQHPQMNPTNSRVAHYCPDGTESPCVWTSLKNLTCRGCKERMPDNIQTAFAIHNADVGDCLPIYGTRFVYDPEMRFHGLRSKT